MARGLAEAGADVIVAGRTVPQLEAVVSRIVEDGGRARAVELDISNPATLAEWTDRIWEETGGVDAVVHSAGAQRRAPALEVSVEDWERIQAVNLAGPFFLSQALARRQLDDDRGGSHVFVASLTTTIGIRHAAPYAASKSGVAGVVRTLAAEWSDRGVRVNAIAPGYYRTPLTEGSFADAERSAWIRSRIPMGRVGEPDDLAGAVVFLASEASAYITGAIVPVDGGWLAT